jgi:hypothetical protein
MEKSHYYCSLVADCGGEQRKLYRLVDSWLGRERARVLPERKSAAELTNRFAAFFNDKVERIMTTLLAEREKIDYKWVLGADCFLDEWSEQPSLASLIQFLRLCSRKFLNISPLPLHQSSTFLCTVVFSSISLRMASSLLS